MPPNQPTKSAFTTTNLDDVTLGLMAKYWTPGRVKTRLATAIGSEAAAELHKLFVENLTQTLSNTVTRRVAVVSPADAEVRFAACINSNWSTTIQSDGDLGNRIQSWFRDTLSQESTDAAILIGADCPILDNKIIQTAVARLVRHGLVLGPAIDGGYYLIGLRSPWMKALEHLFTDVPWSTDQVFKETLLRAASIGLSVATLDRQEDVDTIAELQRLRKSIQNSMSSNLTHRTLSMQIDAIMTKHASNPETSTE